VGLAAVLFDSLPTIAAFGTLHSEENLNTGANTSVRWVLLGAMVAWAAAMAVFRSPVLLLLGNYAPTHRLPQAASLLT
jgi:hypothetical protein